MCPGYAARWPKSPIGVMRRLRYVQRVPIASRVSTTVRVLEVPVRPVR
jgi:hypothetical protein